MMIRERKLEKFREGLTPLAWGERLHANLFIYILCSDCKAEEHVKEGLCIFASLHLSDHMFNL
jgi:hypothetical protein